MSVHLTRRTCLRVPSVAVLDHDGPRGYLRGLVHLVENIQHCLAGGPTGQMVKVQLGHAPKGLGIKLGKDLVRQQGVHPPVWGKPPDRGDTTPRPEPGTGREQSRNTPLGG